MRERGCMTAAGRVDIALYFLGMLRLRVLLG